MNKFFKTLGRGMIYCGMIFAVTGGFIGSMFYSMHQLMRYDNSTPAIIIGILLFLGMSYLMGIPEEDAS